MQNSAPRLSVVIPIHNEDENISELYRRLTSVLESICFDHSYPINSYEIIMVDDGSADSSWHIIKDINKTDPRVKGVSFSRNFGHHAAVLSGLDRSRGDYTILMDGDLQDQPEDIPKLVSKAMEGYDIVQGISASRHSNMLQDFLSRIFQSLFSKIASVDTKTRTGLFRCLSRQVVESMKKLEERAIFLGGIVSWVGFNSTHVNVNRADRYAGKSKYSFLKRFSLAVNAMTSFSEKPLIILFQIGILVSAFSICMFAYAIYKKVMHNVSMLGWTSIFAAIFLSTGLIMLSLSVVGLYISKVFIEIKHRPRYIIREQTE